MPSSWLGSKPRCSAAGHCAFCHDRWNAERAGQPGEAAVLASDCRATMRADAQGMPTWALLRGASYFKDNRLPPKGFVAVGKDAKQVAVCGGAELDANCNEDGSGRDEVTYRVALPETKGRLSVEMELLYQSVKPETVARLLNASEPAAQAFARLDRHQRNQPELVQLQRLEL